MASSKTARLKRRRAARKRRDKQPRKSGRVPVHTRTERKRAALEREARRRRDQRRARRSRKVAAIAVAPVAAAAVITVLQSAHIPRPQLYRPFYAAQAGLASSDKSDSPHTDLMEVMLADPFIPVVGTASPFTHNGPYPAGGFNSWELNGWEQ